MSFKSFSILLLFFLSTFATEVMYTTDFNFKVQPGGRTCFFEKGKAGQMMEIFYQVVDGQHGDLDISLDVIDPAGNIIVTDYKKPENAIIKDLEQDGDYAICLDNTFSVMNSKLVFMYVTVEDQASGDIQANETEVHTLDSEGNEVKEEVLHWMGTDENGESYYIPIEDIAEYMSRTLKHVVKARHMLDLYAASKSRDSYIAYEDTFVVDLWSSIQISFMCVTGLVQVYMIKNLFNSPKDYY